MPESTTNLGLYKANLETDGNMTFNIDSMLNENWDKIDNKYKEQKDSVEEVSAQLADIAHKQGDLTTLQTTAKSDLVGALNEVFQDADNGKTNIYNAIIGKGTTPSSQSFSDLVSAINGISTGKKFKFGYSIVLGYPSDNSTNWNNISCPDFTPSIIIIGKGNSGSVPHYMRGAYKVFNVGLGYPDFYDISGGTNDINVTDIQFNSPNVKIDLRRTIDGTGFLDANFSYLFIE